MPATKTTPAEKLGVTLQPAAAVARANAAATPNPKKVHSFAAWRDALNTARAAAGYTPTSPILGKTDVEILTQVKADLQQLIDYIQDTRRAKLDNAQFAQDIIDNYIDELLKRKVARAMAGQTYRSRKA